MNTKHTAGPWHYYTEPQPNGCPIVGNDRGVMVAMLAHSINHDDERDEAIANARLFASSLQLYDIAKRLANLTEGLESGNSSAEYAAAQLAQQASSLIAKL